MTAPEHPCPKCGGETHPVAAFAKPDDPRRMCFNIRCLWMGDLSKVTP